MWKCEVCGHVHRDDAPLDACPVCGVGWDRFAPFDTVDLEAQGAPAAGSRCTICSYVADGAVPERCPICGAGSHLFEPLVRRAGGPNEAGRRLRIVVVGGGIAGLTAAERAVEVGGNGVSVTLIANEASVPYYRLNLTRLMAGQVSEDALAIRRPEWFAGGGIELVNGFVSSFSLAAKSASLVTGETIFFDRLILANGAHPFVPPIHGTHLGGVFTVRTLDDVREILRAAGPKTRCAVLGGGILGLEAAGALSGRVASVTVLEASPRVMVRQLNERAGELLAEVLGRRGISVMTGASATALEGTGEVSGVRLVDGNVVPASLVLISAGVRPNLFLAKTCGVETSRGVVVDDEMRTSSPDVFAAGDVAEHRGVVYGIWPAAVAQGSVAGARAAGAAASFHGMAPFNQLKVLDVDVFSVGEIEVRDGSFGVFEREAGGAYTALYVRDRRLVGAVLFGNTGLAQAVAEAIERKRSIDELRQWSSLDGWCAFIDR